MRKPFRAQSTVSYQIRDGLMIMCLLVIVVISTKPRHRTGPLVKLVITLACHAGIRSSSLLGTANLGVVQSGRMLALGASGRRFKSCRRDHLRVSYSGNTSAFQADARSSILLTRSILFA